jgi:hypothetical protein
MQFFQKFLSGLRYFFYFQRPVFGQLDFIDIVIDSKPVFLIAWELVNGYRLKIVEPKTVFKKSGAAIIKLPDNALFVDIVACNFWRRRRIRIPLIYVKLDENTISYLVQQFQPVSSVQLRLGTCVVKNTGSVIEIPAIQARQIGIEVKLGLMINRARLNYQ